MARKVGTYCHMPHRREHLYGMNEEVAAIVQCEHPHIESRDAATNHAQYIFPSVVQEREV